MGGGGALWAAPREGILTGRLRLATSATEGPLQASGLNLEVSLGAPGSNRGLALLESSCTGPGPPLGSPSSLAFPQLLQPLSLHSRWDQGWILWAGGELGPGGLEGT